MIRARATAILCLSAVVALGACGDSRERELKWGVETVKGLIEDAGKRQAAAIALQTAEETGGTVLNYVVASLPPDGGALRKFRLEGGRPSRPWTIVVRAGAGPRQYVVEGYGESLAKPLYVETFTIAMVAPPR